MRQWSCRILHRAWGKGWFRCLHCPDFDMRVCDVCGSPEHVKRRIMELSDEQYAKHRAELEGNPVFQKMRMDLDVMRERNIILLNVARDHYPDNHGSLDIHMQPHRMDERGSAAKTSRV